MKADSKKELIDQPTPIPDEIIEKVLAELAPAKQQCAVFQYMLEHPLSYTDAIAREAGAINVPDVVQNLKPKLHKHGLQILSFADPRPNRFGGKSPLHRWHVVQI